MECVFDHSVSGFLKIFGSRLRRSRAPSISWETRHEIDVFSCMVSVEFRLTGLVRTREFVYLFFIKVLLFPKTFGSRLRRSRKPLPVRWRQARLKVSVFASRFGRFLTCRARKKMLNVLPAVHSLCFLKIMLTPSVLTKPACVNWGRSARKTFLARGFGELWGTRTWEKECF